MSRLDSSDDCLPLQDSSLSAIDLDDLFGEPVITTMPSHRQLESPLMRLPPEIRLQIIGFLLPDVNPIDPGNEWGNEWLGLQAAGQRLTERISTTFRHDRAPCEMAIMRTNRQIYEEAAAYLYDRLTVIVKIDAAGVDFLSTRWGCICLGRDLFTGFPLQKTGCVWLQVRASNDHPRHIVHIRRNLLDLCGALYQVESHKGIRVDLWDSYHGQASAWRGYWEPTGVQGGVPVVTKTIEHIMHTEACTKEVAEKRRWGTRNSTGTALVATDVELVLQPLKLLRNVKDCQIFLNPAVQANTLVVSLVARHKEMVEGVEELKLEDLQLVHDTSEDLYRLAETDSGEGIDLESAEHERMEKLLWQTRKWHSFQAAA